MLSPHLQQSCCDPDVAQTDGSEREGLLEHLKVSDDVDGFDVSQTALREGLVSLAEARPREVEGAYGQRVGHGETMVYRD